MHRPQQTQHPLVGFLEAAYAWERDDAEWLRGVLRAARDSCPAARMAWGVLHDSATTAVPRIERVVAIESRAGARLKQPLLRVLTDPRHREIFRKRVTLRRLQPRLAPHRAADFAALNQGGVSALLTINGEPRACRGHILAPSASAAPGPSR
jgi:hypothetical protein